MSKKYDDPIEVETSSPPMGGVPAAFVWRGRRYPVERVLKRWREVTESWDPERVRDLEWLRVESFGGTYEIHLDRRLPPPEYPKKTENWRLARVWD